MSERRSREVGGESGAGQSQGAQVAEQVKEKAEQAKEKAQPAIGQAREKAQELRGQAASRAREQVDMRSTQAGEQARSIADAVRRTGDHLRSEGKEQPAKVAEQAAERAERLASYLTESDGDRILRDAQDLVRRQPWLVAAAAGAAGFLAARFLRASGTGGDGQPSTDGRPSMLQHPEESARALEPPVARAPAGAGM